MSENEKQEILEMLANKEISKEEAERKLQELGDPIEEPEMVQPAKKNKNKGCLIAIIIASILLPILGVILFILLALFVTFERKAEDSKREMIMQEKMAIERDMREIELKEEYLKEEANKKVELKEEEKEEINRK